MTHLYRNVEHEARFSCMSHTHHSDTISIANTHLLLIRNTKAEQHWQQKLLLLLLLLLVLVIFHTSYLTEHGGEVVGSHGDIGQLSQYVHSTGTNQI